MNKSLGMKLFIGCIFLVPISVIALVFSRDGLTGTEAPFNESLTIDTTRCQTYEDLLNAIEWVESRGDANAIGDDGRAVGAYQLTKIYVDDINRLANIHNMDTPFNYELRFNKEASRLMAIIYMTYYVNRIDGPITDEYMARIHNAGPDGWRDDPEWFVRNRGYTLERAERKIANAKEYWGKIKLRLSLTRKE